MWYLIANGLNPQGGTTMDTTVVEQTIEGILNRMKVGLMQMVTSAAEARTPEALAALERIFRQRFQEQVRLAYQDLLQAASDAGDGGRVCQHCASSRRHKGRRPRKFLTSLGPVSLDGVCWQCEGCGRHEHASQRLGLDESTTAPMRELICLLGLSQGSFAHAGLALQKLLGVRLSTPTVACVCEEQGQRIEAAPVPPAPPARLVEGTLVGSCDGTMVNTRQEGWRELRAWRFDDDAGRRASGAALENAAAFCSRLRQEALAQHADQVKQFVFVSDAADWIKQAVAEHLPEVRQHVVDIYHAYQHVHDAAKLLYGEGTQPARAWAQRWCDELYTRGGRATCDRLRHARFARPDQQQALEQLLGFLDRHADRMDYPRYRADQLPVSSGPMESTCKQLGQRLKGPGMRWHTDHVTPMAHLISLWNDQRWDAYWLANAG
jgi:hypothetical protein